MFLFIHILHLKGETTENFDQKLNKIKYFALNNSASLCSNTSQFGQNVHISIYNPINGVLSKVLADRYKDDYILWGIKNTPEKNYYHPLEIFYSDRELKNNITYHKFPSVHYKDAGIVCMRSGWEKDDNFITLKSTSYNAITHKDQNNMEIFLGEKEMFIESGTCFEGHHNFEMRYFGTHAHNVILIDNKPQLPKGNSKGGIKKFITTEHYDLAQGDASGVYSKAKVYLRNLLFIKPNILVLYDYVLLNSIGVVEWLWHTPGSIHVHSLSKRKSILFSNEDKNMSMFILQPDTWTYRLTKDFALADWWTMHEKTHDVLRIKTTFQKEHNMFCLFNLNSNEHETLPCEFENNTIKLNYNNENYNISFNKGEIVLG